MPTTSTKNCWIAGAILGLLVWLFTAGIGTLGWFAGLFLGIIAAVLFGSFLVWAVCSGHAAMLGDEWSPRPIRPGASPIDPQPRGLASEATVGFLGSAEGPKPVPSPQPAVAPKVEPEAAAVKVVETSPAPSGKKIETTAPKAADMSGGQPDNLKEIKGVGPKLEETLHENGITRFAQIAAWTEADVDRFAEVIGRMGSRIRTDDWVAQARILATGGETEFSQRVEKGEVY
jgi:predicted flap endonuclease-1-like 5' DNA nuclease